MSVWDGVERVAFVHAHPDDETLASGALIVELVERGLQVSLLTCTRGECGEVVAGSGAPPEGSLELVIHRQLELAGALAELGVEQVTFLGSPPARAAGAEPRLYSDSGMVWVTETVAGPADDAPDNALSLADLDEVTADLAAWLRTNDAQVVVSYDRHGGYGHPDHVRVREACEGAVALLRAEGAGVRLVELIPADRPIAAEAGIEWDDLSRHQTRVAAALRRHASQLTVTDTPTGPQVVHVGGQQEAIATQMGLRPVDLSPG